MTRRRFDADLRGAVEAMEADFRLALAAYRQDVARGLPPRTALGLYVDVLARLRACLDQPDVAPDRKRP